MLAPVFKFNDDGGLIYQRDEYGTERWYHSNGSLRTVSYPSGRLLDYSENGILNFEREENGRQKWYDAVGLTRQVDPDGTEHTYENGQLQSKRHLKDDGYLLTAYEYYEDGSLKAIYNSDGFLMEF